jgi:uncharacterized protein (DUF39 family)
VSWPGGQHGGRVGGVVRLGCSRQSGGANVSNTDLALSAIGAIPGVGAVARTARVAEDVADVARVAPEAGSYVYRGLAEGESATAGLVARNPRRPMM